MMPGFANVPNRKPLMSQILHKEGALTDEQVDASLRAWFARRKEAHVIAFAEVVIRLGYMSAEEMRPYLALQRVLATPPSETRKLGALVLENGLVKPSQLAEVLLRQQETGRKLGELLIEAGLVRKPQLALLLRLQGRRFTARLALPPGS